jgi:hypothetical protein
LITDEALTMAAGPDNADPALAQQFLGPTGPGPTGPPPDERGVVPSGDAVLAAAPTAADAVGSDAVDGSQRRDQGLTWYGDSAYGTGELRDAIERAGDRAVIKPKPMQPAVAGGFTLDDFAVDEPTGTVTCPARADPVVVSGPDRDLRCVVPRLPAACWLHHGQDRARDHPART